jgi:hypothetical protein
MHAELLANSRELSFLLIDQALGWVFPKYTGNYPLQKILCKHG